MAKLKEGTFLTFREWQSNVGVISLRYVILWVHLLNCIDGCDQMEEESVDLVVTSPPYDNLRGIITPPLGTLTCSSGLTTVSSRF